MNLKELQPSKRLDAVLRIIKSNPYFKNFEIRDLIISKGYHTGSDEIDSIIAKLLKDKFIDRDISIVIVGPRGYEHFIYFCTFEGETLLELEKGYSGRLETEKLKNKNAKLSSLANTILSGIGGALLVYILTSLQTCQDKKPQHVVLDSLKIPTYDTVFLINQACKKDTSLIRILKQPQKKVKVK